MYNQQLGGFWKFDPVDRGNWSKLFFSHNNNSNSIFMVVRLPMTNGYFTYGVLPLDTHLNNIEYGAVIIIIF